jgi:hypothetical protein
MILLVAALAWLPAPAAGAGEYTVRYAGTVRAFDGRWLVLEDVGPAQDQGAEAAITPRTIQVTPRTALFVAIRAEDAGSGFAGDYRETRAAVADLAVGAFVSVQCQPEGPRCRALKLVIVRTAQS